MNSISPNVSAAAQAEIDSLSIECSSFPVLLYGYGTGGLVALRTERSWMYDVRVHAQTYLLSGVASYSQVT